MSQLGQKNASLLARDLGYFYTGEDVIFTILIRAGDESMVDADSVLVNIKDEGGNSKAAAPAEKIGPGVFRYKYSGAALSAGVYRVQCEIGFDGNTHLSDIYEFTIREAL